MWRVLLVLALLPACDLYFGSHTPPDHGDDVLPDANLDCGPVPDEGVCDCVNGNWWCTTCPFGEGTGPAPCDDPGASCHVENWEHGCDCSCGSDGYWACSPETVGSTCPTGGPPPDAATAVECQSVEAETLASDAPGWTTAFGGGNSGGEALSALTAFAKVTYTVTGTGVEIYYEAGPNMGTYSVVVDDNPAVLVDAQQPGAFTFGNVATIADFLASGDHTVTITCTSLDCELDRVVATCR